MLFQRPRRLALHTPCAKQQGGGGFKHKGTTFERDNHEQLLAIEMTLLVEPIRNLPFMQGLPHGSSLWAAVEFPWVTSIPLSLLQSNTATEVRALGGSLLS